MIAPVLLSPREQAPAWWVWLTEAWRFAVAMGWVVLLVLGAVALGYGG